MSEVAATADGFVVNAEAIAAAFGIEPESVPERMRTGEITSRCEMDIDEAEGRVRLIIDRGGRALRLAVDGSGRLLSRAPFAAAKPIREQHMSGLRRRRLRAGSTWNGAAARQALRSWAVAVHNSRVFGKSVTESCGRGT